MMILLFLLGFARMIKMAPSGYPLSFSEVNVQSDISESDCDNSSAVTLSSSTCSACLEEQLAVLTLSGRAKPASVFSSFEIPKFQDVEFRFCRVAPYSKEVIPIDSSDFLLMERIPVFVKNVPISEISGFMIDYTGDRNYFSFPFSYLKTEFPPGTDFASLYAEPSTFTPVPVENQVLNTPPRTGQRKRIKLPETPLLLTDMQARCKAAREVFEFKVGHVASGFTVEQETFNSILRELDLLPFSPIDFHAYKNDFRNTFLELVNRCPERYFVSASILSLVEENDFTKFLTLYKRFELWGNTSRSFSLKLLKGIMLLPSISVAGTQFFSSIRNPVFFFNHVCLMRSFIGPFHLEQIIEAVSFARIFTNFGQNQLAKWILSQLKVPDLNDETSIHTIQGLLTNMHKSRCLFETDEDHISYMQRLFSKCIHMFAENQLALAAALGAFIKSDMLELIYEAALRDMKVDILSLILTYITVEAPVMRVCDYRSVSMNMLNDSEFVAEIEVDCMATPLKYLLK